MRISREAIYQSLYIQGRGALKRELVWCLRTGRPLRVPRERSRRKAWAHVTPETLISQRPAEAEDRAVPGHWEGDLLIGLEGSAVGTVVERKTRYTMLVHLPPEDGYRHEETPKNGPALAGYGAITMKNALAETMSTLPEQFARSLTWDRGKEMSAHAQFKIETGISVFFADPQSPWQRGTDENTNGLLRQYFRRAQTSADGQRKRSKQSLTPSTTDHVRHLTGRRPPKHSTSRYCYSNKQVLHSLVEPGQYTSGQLARFARRHDIAQSVGRTRVCWDNAQAESFGSTLKSEFYHRSTWPTKIAARLAVGDWIERIYNRRRRHSKIGMISPVDFEYRHTQTAQAA